MPLKPTMDTESELVQTEQGREKLRDTAALNRDRAMERAATQEQKDAANRAYANTMDRVSAYQRGGFTEYDRVKAEQQKQATVTEQDAQLAAAGGTPAPAAPAPAAPTAVPPALGPRPRQGSRPSMKADDAAQVTNAEAKAKFTETLNKDPDLKKAVDAIANGTATKEQKELAQNALITAGYDIGKFGPKQDGVDGIVGDHTATALKEAMGPSYHVVPEHSRSHTHGHGHGHGHVRPKGGFGYKPEGDGVSPRAPGTAAPAGALAAKPVPTKIETSTLVKPPAPGKGPTMMA
jgi:hypothetical protein